MLDPLRAVVLKLEQLHRPQDRRDLIDKVCLRLDGLQEGQTLTEEDHNLFLSVIYAIGETIGHDKTNKLDAVVAIRQAFGLTPWRLAT